jgi:hypothetical protein
MRKIIDVVAMHDPIQIPPTLHLTKTMKVIMTKYTRKIR